MSRKFSALTTKAGVVLCDTEEGAFLVLKNSDELIQLKRLVDKIIYFSPDEEDLFNDE